MLNNWMDAMTVKRNWIFGLVVLMVYGCASQDTGFYKHSESFPPLEMPPDLIKASEEDAFAIPNIAASVVKNRYYPMVKPQS